MVDCKPADTPMIPNQRLYMEDKTKVKAANLSQYQRIVGKLIYLAHTRPDIAHSVRVVSQFMNQPQHHMDAVWRIIRYLKGTAGDGVLFQKNNHLETQIFTDAGYGGEKGDRKSASGYFSLVGGNLVAWKSKKQKVVALSSVEAEFRGITHRVTEALWIKKLLTEIGFPPETGDQHQCFLATNIKLIIRTSGVEGSLPVSVPASIVTDGHYTPGQCRFDVLRTSVEEATLLLTPFVGPKI
ncbi:secreted RxLR effector protein 161-like [Rutidosis leptorrhynchoides]|uniref:secreted RxLR effector protein 161-like n=1 Tax=Rutidosis leptorrhynchoides TaxID=125765 RepID=UPI003A98E40F